MVVHFIENEQNKLLIDFFELNELLRVEENFK